MIYITPLFTIEPDCIEAISRDENYTSINIYTKGGHMLHFEGVDTKAFTPDFIALLEAKLQLPPGSLPRIVVDATAVVV